MKLVNTQRFILVAGALVTLAVALSYATACETRERIVRLADSRIEAVIAYARVDSALALRVIEQEKEIGTLRAELRAMRGRATEDRRETQGDLEQINRALSVQARVLREIEHGRSGR